MCVPMLAVAQEREPRFMTDTDEYRLTLTTEDTPMPIHLDSNDGDGTPPVSPGSNAHELLEVLADHPDMGFAPRELAELTDVPHGSVHKTLSRLEERGLVRNLDSYWAIADDVAASHVANVVSLAAIDETYGDDAYGEDDEWAIEQPDLGENA